MGLTVAKVGGSLFDLPDLRERLRTRVAEVGGPVLLVPGGGAAVDVIRQLDEAHRLGEELAHWLALRVLTVNAHFLGGLLGAPVVPRPPRAEPTVSVLDPHAFGLSDMSQVGSLEHSWRVTSDAIAARVAEVTGTALVLLKSTDLPDGTTWAAAAAAGLVDKAFEKVVRRAGLKVSWFNLRR